MKNYQNPLACIPGVCARTTQHNTTQHNTTQHNTTQHNTHNRNRLSVFFQNLLYICCLMATFHTNAQSTVVTPTSPTPTSNYLTRWINGSIYQIESSQIYDDGTSVGLGTNSPLGKFNIVDGAVLFNGTTGGTPTAGAGVRLMWVPNKAAFRAGEAYNDYWDSINVGNGSMASGYITKASGHYTFAYGYDCEALGLHSFAGGHGNRARADGSIAIGSHNSISATSNESIAIGSDHTVDAANALALGTYSYVTGQNAVAINGSAAGNYSYAIGGQTLATGTGAVALGNNNTAGGDYSLALGSNSDTKSYKGCFVYSDAETFFGAPPVENTADNQFVTRATGGYILHTDANLNAGKAFVFGNNQQFHIGQDFKFENNEFRANLKINSTYTAYSSGIYYDGDKGGFHAGHTSFMHNSNVGYYSNSMGLGNFTEGNFQNGLGKWNILHAGAHGSSAIGSNNVINGVGAFAAGNHNALNGDSSVALGNYNTTGNGNSLVLGNYASDNGKRGSMVLSDASVPTLFGASSDQQFNVRATGGVRIFTDHTLPTSNIFSIAPSTGYLGLGVASAGERLEVDGRITLAPSSAPGTTTNKLYNVSGNLYWNGSNLTAGALPGGGSNQTLRYNGSNWVASSVLENNGTNLTLNGNLIPGADATYNIGTGTLRINEYFGFNTSINGSDSRLKKEITNLNYGISEIMKLRPVSYKWNKKELENGTRLGFIAQEVLEVIPEVVVKNENPNVVLGMRYSELIPLLVKGIQEQQIQIAELQNQIVDILSKQRINSLGENKQEKVDFQISPNPANRVLSFKSLIPFSSEIYFQLIEITDGSGKLIVQTKVTNLEGQITQINIADFAPGKYYIKGITNNKFELSKSFLVVK